jgi:hypothetical protein
VKALYYLVTFLAALVVLGWAGWEGYLHYEMINNIVAVPHSPTPPTPNCQCGCTETGNCKCQDCDHPALKKN